jgi:hypothetical protein
MTRLTSLIEAEAGAASFPAAAAFCETLKVHYGASTAAIVFYGSCLREKTDVGLLLDFYVLVDRYTPALKNPISAFFARLLPPNVYYMEIPFEGRAVRAKVAVISVDQFLRGTGPEAFASSLWARFAQPSAILYARNDEVRRRVTDALASAVSTMMIRSAPLMGETYFERDLWARAFSETYRAELRPEQESKAAELVEADLPRYAAVTDAVLGPRDSSGRFPQTFTPHQCAQAQWAWRLRRIQGKTLNALRLVKAAFTFSGGLDYAVWKIERHSGVKIELTDAERQRPLLTGLKLFWRTWRQGGVR